MPTLRLTEQFNKYQLILSTGMSKSSLFLIVFLAIAPLAFPQSCTTASKSLCGTTGSSCQYYAWVNGTCVAPTACPTSPTYTIWSNSSANCIACDGASSSVCSSCPQQQFYFNTRQNLCTTCSNTYGSNCLKCNSTQCITCAAGYQLSTDLQSCFNGACPIDYCQTCANSFSCATCDSVHFAYSGYCVCSIANCEICSSGICLSCYDGYALSTSKTKCNFICIANCDVCTDLYSCTTCSLGYYFDATTIQCRINCTTIDKNCAYCTTTTVCSSCNDGYSLSASGNVCNIKCSDSNCVTCNPSNNCSRCLSGFKSIFNTTTSTYVCSSDICQINSCVSCASQTTCAKCADNYLLSTDQTTCNPNCGISNCAYCASASSCQTCNDGYKVSNGLCVPTCSISNCKLCSTSSACLNCNDGFLLSSNSQSCNYNCGIIGCITCNSINTCSQCYAGSSLGSGGTICIVNCQDGYFLNSTLNACMACPASNCLTCDSVGRCLNCINLYYLNNTDFQCYACSSIANCFNCQSGNNVCTTCVDGYYLLNKVCINQNTCSVSNCEACVAGSGVTCMKCYSGFSLSATGNACLQIICPTGQTLVGSTCTCGDKMYLSFGQCYSCTDSNCISCPSANLCTSCAVGYYPSGSVCVPCTTNCKTCDSTGCTACKDGYVKNGIGCDTPSSTKVTSVNRLGNQINCDPGCKTCDIDNSSPPIAICREASEGYVLVSGKLFKCSSACKTCSNSPNKNTGEYSICLTCPKGSNFNAGTCSRCTDKNALSCMARNTSHSLTCKPGYVVQNAVCLACLDNCLKCANKGAGSCDTGGCMTGYFQSKNKPYCVKCFNGCVKCGSNPNNCLQCGDYKYLVGNTCESCSANCITCTSSTTCTACDLGFLPTSTGACRSLNIDNCVAYDSNFNCTKCDYNYVLTNNLCILSLECNSTSTCKACKAGYYLSNGNCLTCPSLSNCIYCNQFKSTTCISCAIGYYLSSNGSCTTCPQTGCGACISDLYCTTAKDGYFLAVDTSGAYTGDVLTCSGLCATCLGSPLTCLTCKQGAVKTGTTCISTNIFTIQLTGTLKSLEAGSDQSYQLGLAFVILAFFLFQLAGKFGFASLFQFMANTNLKNLKYGSVTLAFDLNRDSITVDPAATLAASTFTDLTVVSQSVVSNSAAASSVNLGLVLGVAIPLGVLLIAIIVLLKVKSEKVEDQSGLDGTQKDIEYQAEQF